MTLQWERHDEHEDDRDAEGIKSTDSSSARQRTSTSSPFDALDDERSRRSNLSHNSNISNSTQLTYAKGYQRAVHFSDTKGLELTQAVQGDTYYPTPQVARSIVHNGSLRRFTADEVELYFSEDVRRYPVAQDDYAVKKLQERCDVLVSGYMELMKKKTLVLSKWRKCRAELHHGILILRSLKDSGNNSKKRTIIPIASCKIDFLSLANHHLEITFMYQLETVKRRVKFENITDMFIWWWAIQIASKCRCDLGQLHQAVQSSGQITRRDSRKTKTMSSSVFTDQHGCNTSDVFPSDQENNHSFPVQITGGVHFPRSISKRRKSNVDILTTIHGTDVNGNQKVQHIQRKTTAGVTHLLLIRHAEAENIQFRVSDRDKYLTERGHRQAEKTAQYLEKQLREVMATDDNVELIYGGLLRSVETAQIFHKQIPWLRHSYHCCFLEDGAPKEIGPLYRQEYRNAMHKMAFEFICHWDAFEGENQLVPVSELEKYKIVICHTSFIQYCLAQCYQISKDIIQLGAPIAHCSISQIDIKKGDTMTASFSNRVTHLPLTHRTTD